MEQEEINAVAEAIKEALSHLTVCPSASLPVECEYCQDSGMLPGPEPNTTIFCECGSVKRLAGFMSKAPDHVRKRMQGLRLKPGYQPKWYPDIPRKQFGPIVASDYVSQQGLTVEAQGEIIDHLGKNPLCGYTLIGKTGLGKTYFLYALAQEATMSGRRALYYCVPEMIDLARREVMGEMLIELADLPHPEGAPRFPVHLYLDEIDLCPTTDFATKYLFDVLNWCYNFESQVVLSVASNLDLPDLAKVIGPASTRRISDRTVIVRMGGAK